VFKFGKYKDHRAVDVAEVYKANPKTGKDEPVGLKYSCVIKTGSVTKISSKR